MGLRVMKNPSFDREKNMLKLILSFQKLSVYLRCGLQYYFRYIEGIRTPPTSNIAIGAAFHKAVESFYLRKRETGKNYKIDFLLEVYNNEIENILKGDLLFSLEEEIKGRERLKKEVKDIGARILHTYYIQRALYLEPWLVEKSFFVNLGQIAKEFGFDNREFKNVLLGGYIDLVSNKEELIDFKVRRTIPSVVEADKSLQLTIYTLGYREIVGNLPKRVILENIILPSNEFSGGKILTLKSIRTEKDLVGFFRKVLKVINGIRKGIYTPPVSQEFYICTYCGYRKLNICKEKL